MRSASWPFARSTSLVVASNAPCVGLRCVFLVRACRAGTHWIPWAARTRQPAARLRTFRSLDAMTSHRSLLFLKVRMHGRRSRSLFGGLFASCNMNRLGGVPAWVRATWNEVDLLLLRRLCSRSSPESCRLVATISDAHLAHVGHSSSKKREGHGGLTLITRERESASSVSESSLSTCTPRGLTSTSCTIHSGPSGPMFISDFHRFDQGVERSKLRRSARYGADSP